MATATLLLSLFVGRALILPSNHPQFLACIRTCFSLFAGLCLVGVYFSFSRGRLRAP
jgi:hypothetical protein